MFIIPAKFLNLLFEFWFIARYNFSCVVDGLDNQQEKRKKKKQIVVFLKVSQVNGMLDDRSVHCSHPFNQ